MRSTLQNTLTQYLVMPIIVLLFSVGLAGAVERLLFDQSELLMTFPITLTVVSPLLALGLFCQLMRWHAVPVLLGLIALVGASSVLLNFPFVIQDHWLSLPRLIGGIFLLGVSGTFLFGFTRIGHLCAIATACIAFLGFAITQAWLIGLIRLEEPETFANPIAQSIGSIVALLICLVLIAQRYIEVRPKLRLRSGFILGSLCLLIGLVIWTLLTFSDVESERTRAKEESTGLAYTVNYRLNAQSELLHQVVQRLQHVDSHDLVYDHLDQDIAIQVANSQLLAGVVIFDSEMEIILDKGDAKKVVQRYYAKLEDWLNNQNFDDDKIVLYDNLVSDTPFIFMRHSVDSEPLQNALMVVLIRIPGLVATESWQPTFAHYWRVTPDILFSLDPREHGQTFPIDSILANSPPAIEQAFTTANGGTFTLLSVFSSNQSLHTKAQYNQLILFVTFAFLGILAIGQHRTVQLHWLARHDDVTGVFRRHAIQQHVERLRDDGVSMTVVFINLDGFQPINDSMGVQSGDHLLKKTAERLQATVERPGAVGRYGGDEFIVVYVGTTDDDGEKLAITLKSAIRQPFLIAQTEIHLTASVGVTYLNAGEDGDPLAQAEFAMRRAKQLGGNICCRYTFDMHERYVYQAWLRNKLQLAIDNQQLVVYYQPIIATATERCIAVEALVRWQHKGRFISPDEFIPIAEKTGQIIPLGELVLTQVLRDLAHNIDLKALSVSVNVSSQQLQRYQFPELLAKLLSDTKVSAEAITLELTEGVLVDQSNQNLQALQKLQEMHCTIAIDDFGTGFSSLSYLSQIPAQVIKLDRSFIVNMEHDPERLELVRTIISMCHALGRIVVAEGVETQEQVTILRSLNVDRMQGFYFARPMPLKELLNYLRQPIAMKTD
ncbi:putative bifunctional diguanylate cyclase/phosphodiesterase [Pseudidiomarina sediminum]|uniref:putative bifunctional diguanylate cyclase/phosphodiesterase n=1 Tax=Pseudidiomarina sediminum TaxID=431675 RepID=UPI001C96781E|nr:bifunctional diguanylate cyclase/phosphodiesterase [Pseudidiomarina sediminum]MBY6064536.1 EAL domain-containing protein [Pseudidiomarina sediminum]